MESREREELEAILGHRFRDEHLLVRALTHRSCRAQEQQCRHNEQLEFLGDAVLGLVVSRFLFVRFPDWSEGQLSRGRAYLASTRALAEAGRRTQLGRFLQLGPGEEKSGGRDKCKLLANAYEAIVGAIYLDEGFEAAQRFIERTLLEPELAHGFALTESDHKSALQEWLQARRQPPAVYRVVSASGPDHAKLFEVAVLVDGQPLAVCSGRSKKEAEKQAAALALERLRQREATEQVSSD